MKLSLKDIANKTNGTLVGKDVYVESVCTDSRLVKDGSLFAVIKGERVDAMKFAPDVDEKFDCAFITDRPIENIKGSYVIVEDVIKAIGDIANLYLTTVDLKRIAVTGSVGKTTTKNYIASALSECMNVHYSKGNNNNELGMPMTVLAANQNHDAVILEMGMRGMGQIEYLCNIATPDVAVITNVGICHIELLGSRENILLAKSEIIDGLDKNGVAVINCDDDMLKTLNPDKKTIRYGIENENSDVRAVNVKDNKFDLVYDGKSYPVTLGTLGIHNVYNALAAISVGIALSCDIHKLIKGVEGFTGDGSRQNIYEFNGLRIFDDTYNASPDSMIASMNVMKGFEGRKVVVLADMLELGDYTKEAHQKLSKPISELDASVCILIGQNMRYLADALSERQGVYHCNDNQQALEIIKATVKIGDNVLFKGSNSMNLAGLLKIFKGE